MNKTHLNIQELLSGNDEVYIPTHAVGKVNEAVQYWRKGTSESNLYIVSSKLHHHFTSTKMTFIAVYTGLFKMSVWVLTTCHIQ